MGKTVRRKRKSRIKKRKTRVKKRRSRIKKRKAHFKRRTRVKKRKFINKKTRRKKRRTIQKGGLGFKDLFMALSLLTASLARGADGSPLPSRTENAIYTMENESTPVCSTRESVSNVQSIEDQTMYTDSLSPKGLFRDAALGLHTDRVDFLDKDKSTAAGYMGALSDIMNELKEKQDNIPAGTCLTLFNAVGPENWKKMIEIMEFMKRQHGIEERDEKGDNTDGKKESDGNGNKSDDPEKRDSNLGLITATATALGGLHWYDKHRQRAK